VKASYPNRALRYDFVKAFKERIELVLDGLVEAPLDVLFDEEVLVLACDLGLAAVRNQLDDFLMAPVVIAGREVEVHLLHFLSIENVA
jgi:hypothetical protein